ncbi:MAG: GNAT family N-acetyltransferase, partial [Pseudomonadota bacterium]
GQGLGDQLLTQCMTWLKAHFDHIFLSVYAENIRAQKLYTRFGFKKVHDYHYMVGNHADPEWIMRWFGG